MPWNDDYSDGGVLGAGAELKAVDVADFVTANNQRNAAIHVPALFAFGPVPGDVACLVGAPLLPGASVTLDDGSSARHYGIGHLRTISLLHDGPDGTVVAYAATAEWDGDDVTPGYNPLAGPQRWEGRPEVQIWGGFNAGNPRPQLLEYLYNQTDYTRQYPLEFLDLAFANLLDGDVASGGDNARYVGDGRVYQWDGAAWVKQPHGTEPDVVTTFGAAEGGDFWGGWLYNETQGVINVLLDLSHRTRDGGGVVYKAAYGEGATIAAAKADAEANWAGSPLAGPEGDAFNDKEYSVVFDEDGTGIYDARLITAARPYDARDVQIGLASDVDFYAIARTGLNPNLSAGGAEEFDGGAEGLTADLYHCYDTVANDGTGTVQSAVLGDNSQPAWPTAAPAAGESVVRGWYVFGVWPEIQAIERVAFSQMPP